MSGRPVIPPGSTVAADVPRALASVLGIPTDDVVAEPRDARDADLVLSAAGHVFLVEVLPAATAGRVAVGAERLVGAVKRLRRRVVPLVAVPFMSEAGRRACEGAGVSWLDLSGNGRISAPGLRVVVDGHPNRFRPRGRPSSVFAPKSARVVRWLLMHPDRAFTQREIARATDMTEGYVSRIVARLEADHYVTRAGGGGRREGDRGGHGDGRRERAPVRVRDPSLLLDAWRDEYQFSKHAVVQGHVAARSGDALARFVGDTLGAMGAEHAATGLAAAWQITRLASFRIATFFVVGGATAEVRARLGFRDDARGANLWLVAPNDIGVLHGAEDRDGLRCVHPVQAYLDLAAHPERAAEAAEHLRSACMNWERDG